MILKIIECLFLIGITIGIMWAFGGIDELKEIIRYWKEDR